MGAGQSGLGEKFGFHVIKVSADGPGGKAGLAPYFDFIVAANNVRLDTDDATFVEIIKQFQDKPLTLQVYDARTMQLREVTILPTDKWPGEGLLGVTIRFASFENAFRNGVHVLDVFMDSPSAGAGLQPREDFIVGTPSSLFHDDNEFYWLLEKYEGKPLTLLVYSGAHKALREVTLTPDTNWGGNGALGCELGQGWLHDLPGFAPHDTVTRPLATHKVDLPTEPAVPPFQPPSHATGGRPPASQPAASTPVAAPPATTAAAAAPVAASPAVAPAATLSSTPGEAAPSPATPANPALAAQPPAEPTPAPTADPTRVASEPAVPPVEPPTDEMATVALDSPTPAAAQPTPVYPPGTAPAPVLPPE